jgi:hypothetical protein
VGGEDRHVTRGWFIVAAVVVMAAGIGSGQEPPPEPLDPLQRAVVDSLAFPARTTPEALLDAALRAADVGATSVAIEYVARLVESLDALGDAQLERLGDLGENFGTASLTRLQRLLQPRAPEAARVVAAIRAAGNARRSDVARLDRAAADLAAGDAAARAAAIRRLAAAGVDALPQLAGLVQQGAQPAAGVAVRLLRDLGDDARQPLLAWLGSDDVDAWPAVISALEAIDAADVDDFLLAPALVDDAPPAVRAAARRALAAGDRSRSLPGRTTAVARLTRRLDGVLGPAGLPAIDHLMLEPVTDPAAVAAAFGGSLTGTVERFVWSPQDRRVVRRALPPRLARALEADHLARDIVALAADDAEAVRFVLLARLESALAAAAVAGPQVAGRPDAAALRARLEGPDGFDAEMAAAVMDAAIERGLWDAAAAAATALEPSFDDAEPEPLPATVRKSLVRALALPDAAVQFAAARTLALAGGDAAYAGSSQVLRILVHAATATGEDRVVVAHPDRGVGLELASGISRFGYTPEVVRTGREAVFAARASADTVLILLAARSITPGALETVQYLQQPGLGSPPAVLIVVDPLDDDGRGCYLQRLLLSFADIPGVAIVDRLSSFFQAEFDAVTGQPTTGPRFPDALAQLAGPMAVDPASRAAARDERLARAAEALRLLAWLAVQRRDVTPALDAALLGIRHPELATAAATVLGGIGRPIAQYTLFREAGRPAAPAREAAAAALAAHVARHGVLLDPGTIDEVCARYTRDTEAAERSAARGALEALGVPAQKLSLLSVDAAPARSTR